jgi:hypothetical protein
LLQPAEASNPASPKLTKVNQATLILPSNIIATFMRPIKPIPWISFPEFVFKFNGLVQDWPGDKTAARISVTIENYML